MKMKCCIMQNSLKIWKWIMKKTGHGDIECAMMFYTSFGKNWESNFGYTFTEQLIRVLKKNFFEKMLHVIGKIDKFQLFSYLN